jgi:hypothetical protein
MLASDLKRYWWAYAGALAYVGVLDGLLSLLNTCHPQYDQSANTYSYADSCKFFQGPIITRVISFVRLFDANATIALFTGVLAISTIALWEATRRGAAIAADALTKLERAFVLPEAIEVDVDESRGRHFGFRVKWKNSGSSPAIDIRMHVNWVHTDRLLDETFTYPDHGPSDDLPKYLGPSGNLWSVRMDIGGEMVASAKRGGTFLFFYGWITYRDIFDGTPVHRTTFCQQAEIRGTDPMGPAGRLEWAFRAYGPHNSID